MTPQTIISHLETNYFGENIMCKDIKSKIVVVTGGAKGIGYEIVINFIKKCAKNIVILDKDEDCGNKAEKNINEKYGKNKVHFIKCDVTKNVEEVFKKIIDTYKTIDVLVNSAGILNDTLIKETVDVNVTALIEWTLKFWEHMRKDKGGKGGCIINMSSVYGYKSNQFLPVYQASQFAVMGFTRSLGHEYNYERSSVRVIAICPGLTETDMTADMNTIDDEDMKIGFYVFLKFQDWQKVDIVGKATVEIFETANSGTAWVVEGNKSPLQIL